MPVMSLITYLKAWHYKLEETKITIVLFTVSPSEFKVIMGLRNQAMKKVCVTNNRKVIRYMKISRFVNQVCILQSQAMSSELTMLKNKKAQHSLQ